MNPLEKAVLVIAGAATFAGCARNPPKLEEYNKMVGYLYIATENDPVTIHTDSLGRVLWIKGKDAYHAIDTSNAKLNPEKLFGNPIVMDSAMSALASDLRNKEIHLRYSIDSAEYARDNK